MAQTPTTSYLTTDHLGSPRIITDALGTVVARKDFSAFGDETFTPQRTESLGYKPENIRQDYTGYQKDDETRLEFAQARYYNSSHGRFTSIDPLTASANVKNPQTFNRYSYALNSPYKFTDPLGLISTSTGSHGDNQDDRESASPVTKPEEITPTVVIPKTLSVTLNGKRMEVEIPEKLHSKLQKIAEEFEKLQVAYTTNKENAIKFGTDVAKKLEEERVAGQGLLDKLSDAIFGSSPPPAQQVSVTQEGQVVVPTEWSNSQGSSTKYSSEGEGKGIKVGSEISTSSSQTANVKSSVSELASAANSQRQMIEKRSLTGAGNLYSEFKNMRFTISASGQKTTTMTKAGWEQLYRQAMLTGINAAGNRPK